MNIHITLIAYALDLTPLIMALQGEDVYWHVFQHSRNMDVILKCQALALVVPNFTYFDYRENRGLSTSWNDGLVISQAQGADAMLILNDDVQISRDDMLKMAQGGIDHPECGIIEAEGWNERMQEHQRLGFACFGINQIALDVVGLFDEQYYVIYGEDVDYSRRCNLLGVTFHNVGQTKIVHKGSETIATVPALRAQNQVTFPRNENYHRLKHGGPYGRETFQYPFGDPQLSWRIDTDQRHNPYPAHQRQDKDVAKI